MQTSPFMNTKCSIKGYEFAPNNFCAPLEKSVFPDDFHIIIDFLTCSPIYYALTQPTKVTFKSVMQIWSTLKFINGGQTEKSKLTFNYNGKEYVITPEAVSYTHLRAHETREDLVCRLSIDSLSLIHI